MEYKVLTDGMGKSWLIEDIETWENGAKITYRTYSLKYENGGYKTTLWLKGNGAEDLWFFALGNEHTKKVRHTDLVITKRKTDNVVSEKWQFNDKIRTYIENNS